jgi:tetratricopeptide (TPR) repeat protein
MPSQTSASVKGRFVAVGFLVVIGTAVAGAAAAAPEYIPDRNVGIPVGAAAGLLGFYVGLVWDRQRSRRAAFNDLAGQWSELFTEGPSVARTDVTAEERSPVRLLAPEREAVPFESTRYRNLGSIRRWCMDGGAGLVWLLSGEPGSGKTRLAIQIAKALRAGPWDCGWLGPDGVEGIRLATRWSRPVLVIIDDAETRSDLAAVITEAHLAEAANPIKLLLVARDFGEWWTATQKPFRFDVNTSGHVTSLGNMAEEVSRQIVAARRAASAFAEGSPISTSAISFTGIELGTPMLQLHAAALEGVMRLSENRPASVDLGSVIERTIERERTVWWDRASQAGLGIYPAVTPAVLSDVLVLSMLIGGRDTAASVRLLKSVPGLASATDDLVERLIVWLHLYNRVVGYVVRPHLPALFAEHLTAQTIATDQRFAAAVAAAADNPARVHFVLAVILRSSLHTEAGSAATANFLKADPGRLLGPGITAARGNYGYADAAIAEVVTEARMDRATVSALRREVPRRTLVLAETGIALATAAEAGAESPHERADLLGEITERMLNVWRSDDACSAGRRAVEVARGLNLATVAGRARLIENLCLQAGALRRLSRPVEAMAHAREASTLADGFLAGTDRDHAIWRARAADTLAYTLTYANRFAEAVNEGKTAVELIRALYEKEPDEFRRDYANVLATLAEAQRKAQDYENSLENVEKAYELLSELSSANPDGYLRERCHIMVYLSRSLSDMDHHQRAIDLLIECSQIVRTAPTRKSLSMRLVLLDATRAQASTLRVAGRYGEAVVVGRQAVSRVSALAESHPEYNVYVVDDLVQLARALRATQRADDAVVTARQAVDLCGRVFTDDESDPRRGDLGMAVFELAEALQLAGRTEECLDVAERAVHIFSGVVRDSGEAIHRAKLAEARAIVSKLAG